MAQAPQLNVAIILSGALTTLCVLGSVLLPSKSIETSSSLTNQSASELEQRLGEIKSQLEKLAQYSLRSGVGAIGYRSQAYEDADHSEWIKIDLGREYSIDQIVLVPTLLREAASGFRAEGFPEKFKIIIGTGTEQNGTVVATYDANDQLLPRIAPVVIACNKPGQIEETKASWILIEAQRLTPRQFDGKFVLQFAEILAFSGEDIVTLGQPIHTSSNVPDGPAWDQSFAVDGFTPYLMNGAGGKESLAYVSFVAVDDQPSFTIDLEDIFSINQVNLHGVDQSDTVPQTHRGDFGVPKLLRVEGASQADFSDAKLLTEYQHANIFDTGPIIIRRFTQAECQYVRFSATNPFEVFPGTNQGARFGFAEIEIIANGKNVALNKTARSDQKGEQPRSIVALTDGNNYFGQILPLRQWLEQLEIRHDLESERPLVEAELNRRYQRQRTNLNRLMWLALLLGVGIFGAVVIGRNLRQRAIVETRERIAADLHDELGANVHAIGLLADLATASADSPKKLKPIMRRIREFTQRAGTAATYCANMLESKGLYDDLVADMRRSAKRILADIEHDIKIEGEENLNWLKPRNRIDLFLFYKECLINIIRHSGATKVTTRLNADPKQICLIVNDNGSGFSSANETEIPRSLKRRARLLGGVVTVHQPEKSGTQVTLKLKPGKFAKLRLNNNK